MAQTIKLRRSAVAGNRPTTAQLDLGELAINTVDGKIYFEKSGSNGESIQEIFTTNATNSGSLTTIGNVTVTGSLNVSGSETIKGYVQFMPVTTNIDTQLSASYIYVSGSTNDLYFSQNGNGYANTTRLRWLEGNLYTGLLNGGKITAVTGSTVFSISSGSGIIVNLNASLTDNPYPTVKYVNWDNITNIPITNISTAIQTFVGISSTGEVIQQTNAFNDGEYNTIITLGTVLHQNQSTVNASITYPNVAYGYKQRTYDFIKAFGPLKLTGFPIQTSGSLGLTIGSGTAWADGRNYQTDPNNPSYINDPGTSVSKIFRYHQSGSSFIQDTKNALGYTSIDPTQYNNNGTLTSVTGNNPNNYHWTLQRVFWYPNSATKGIVVYYGNTEYPSETEAIANLSYETFTEVENTKQNAIQLGTIALRKDANWDDASTYTILPSGIFRNVGGSGGGGAVSAARLQDLLDTYIVSPTNGELLIYDSNINKWRNSSPSQLTSSLDSHYIVSGSITQTTWENINGKPDGIVSSSSQLTESYDARYALSGSLGSGGGISAIYIATQGVLQGTASYFDFNGSGVNATINDGTASIQITGGGGGGGGVYNSYFAELSQSSAANTWSFFHDLGVQHPVVTVYDELHQVIQPLTIEALTTSSLEIVFSSARKGYAVATIGSALPYVSASYEGYSLQIIDGTPTWAVSASAVATASYVDYSNVANKPTLVSSSVQVLGGSGVWSGSAQLPVGVVSGSSQLTSSYDSRYVLSGSITQTTWDNIANKPGGIISGSSQLPAGLISGSSQLPSGIISSSAQLPTGVVSGSSQIIGILSPLNAVSASLISKTGSYATTGSNIFVGNQTISASLFVSGTTNFNSAVAINDANVNLTNTASLNLTSGSSIYVANNGIISLTGSLLVTGSASITGSVTATSFVGTIVSNNGVISGSSQLTSSYDLRYETIGRGIVSGSSQILAGSGIWSSSAQMPAGVISSSTQLEGATFDNLTIRNLHTLYETSSVVYASGSNQFGDELTDVQILSGSVEVTGELKLNGVSVITQIPAGTISSSAQLPSGVVSGSSQLTSSYDERYVLSGSITQTTWDNIANKPGGIISSSAQLPADIVSGSSQIILQNTTGQLSASRVDGLNLSQIATGSWTASVANDEFNIIHEGSNIFKLTSGSTTLDNGVFTIKGNSFANGYAEGYTEYGNALIIEGNEIISGALTIVGDSTYNGTTTISGSLVVSGTLNLENANIDNSRYLHVQSTGATTWTVNHNLEYDYPNVIIWDSTGNVIIPDSIVRVSNNQLTVGFISNESGWAHVSVGGISTGQADRFLYTKETAATTWTINHGLNYKYVNVNVYDDNDEMLLPQTITATDENTLTLTFAIATSGNAIISKGGARTTSAFTEFGNGTYGLSGSLNITGSLVVNGDVDAQNFGTLSDVRLKTNLEVIEGALDKVEQLNAYTYDWVEQYNSEGVRQIGLVSQEVQKVQPELVHEKEVVVNERIEKMLLLDYSKVTTLLIGAVKELSEKVKQLENKIGE